MSATSLPFDPFGGTGAPASPVNDPFAGMTSVGIQIPTGDPAAITAAASQAKTLAGLWRTQQSAIRGGSMTALEGWEGQAASAFTDYVGHVTRSLATNAEALMTAAGAMEQLGADLDTAQRMIRALVKEAEQQQAAQQDAEKASAGHAQNLTVLRGQQQTGAGVMTPTAKAHLDRQISSEEGAKADADHAASIAAGDLARTKAQAARFYAEYETAAGGYGRTIQGAADELVGIPLPADGAPSPVTVSKTDRAAAIALLTRIADAHPDDSPADWIRLANGGRSPSPGTLVALLGDAGSVRKPPHMSWWDSFTDGVGLDTSGPTNTAHNLGIMVGVATLGSFGGDGDEDPDGDPDGGGDGDGGGGVAKDLTYDERERVARFDQGVDQYANRGDGRDIRGRYATGNSGSGKADEEEGLQDVEDDTGRPVIRTQVAVRLPNGSVRYYDGLQENPDGTYTAIEVKGPTASYPRGQQTFDNQVRDGVPATGKLNGRPIKITKVTFVRVQAR